MAKMKLWSFQSKAFIKKLGDTSVIYSEWSRCPPNWRALYEMMSRELGKRTGTDCINPPIWCWATGSGGCTPLSKGDLLMLMSIHELTQGVGIIELDVPDRLVITTSYHKWNELIDAHYSKDRDINVLFESMFSGPVLVDEADSIQACIPFIQGDWIIDFHEVTFDHSLPGNRWDEPVV